MSAIDEVIAMHTLAAALPGYKPRHADCVLHGPHLYRVTVERLEGDQAHEAMTEVLQQERDDANA